MRCRKWRGQSKGSERITDGGGTEAVEWKAAALMIENCFVRLLVLKLYAKKHEVKETM